MIFIIMILMIRIKDGKNTVCLRGTKATERKELHKILNISASGQKFKVMNCWHSKKYACSSSDDGI